MRPGRSFFAGSVAFFCVPCFALGWGATACDSSGSELYDAGLGEVGAEAYNLRLTSLSVAPSNDPDASLLVPPFSPGIHDYYVRCGAGTNPLTVSMTTADGGRGVLLEPDASTSPGQTFSVGVQENEAIVVAVTDGKAASEYWVRCLPADFPRIQMVEHPEAGTPVPGYYLLGNQLPLIGDLGYAFVLDGHGVPVWYYGEPTGIFDVDNNAADGAVSFRPFPSSSGWEIHHLSPLATTHVDANGNAIDIHELRRLPNGNYLVFSDLLEEGVDLAGFTAPLGDGGQAAFTGPGTILTCTILELRPNGDIVRTWDGSKHFRADQDSTFEQVTNTACGLAADPFHCNSIDVDPKNGNLLVSGRNMDSVFYLEWPSGKVLWKMGGSEFSDDGATYVPVSDPFHRQHDARLQPGWSQECSGKGQISMFDDETDRGIPARAVVYDVTVKSDGTEKCKAGAHVAWKYQGGVYPDFAGSFRILSDGSRTIGWGQKKGSGGLALTEVDEQGHDLLDLSFTDKSTSFRAIKVPLDALDLGVMRHTAGVPAP